MVNKNKIILTCGNNDFIDDYQSNFEKIEDDLCGIAEKVFGDSDQFLRMFISSYVVNDYCKISYIKRYFKDVMDKSELRIQKDNLMSFYGELCNIAKSSKSSVIFPYIEYSKLMVAYKINTLCLYLGCPFSFDIGIELGKCMNLVENTLVSASINVLSGAFCSLDASFRGSVFSYYHRAINEIGEHPAVAYIYYRMGITYERKYKDLKEADKLYERAISVAPCYYRALFKKSVRFLDMRKLSKADASFKDLIEVLQCKRNNKMLFPIEYEYLCKCYLLLGRIYYNYWEDVYRGNKYFNKAIELIEDDLQNSLFFREFLKDENEIFKGKLEEKTMVKKLVMSEKEKY